MNYNTDGFNERKIYINNSNDKNLLAKMGPSNFDSSFAKMSVESHKNDVTTVNKDKVNNNVEARSTMDSFIQKKNNMERARTNLNNPISNALNGHKFN